MWLYSRETKRVFKGGKTIGFVSELSWMVGISMLYAVTYNIESSYGPGGYVDTSRDEVIKVAKSMAEVALDQMDDGVSFHEWFDLDGNEEEPRNLLQSDILEEVKNIIEQIGDAMKGGKDGYIDFWEYSDIFELIKEQEVTSWCSESLKDQIAQVKKAYCALVNHLSDEWGGF